MDALYEREKHARLNADKEQSIQILKEIVNVAENDEQITQVLRLMSKKKGQMKEALHTMIEHACERVKKRCKYTVVPFSFRDTQHIDILQGKYRQSKKEAKAEDDAYLNFLSHVLKTVVEGKIYLEGLRVQITDEIKQILVAQNRMHEALDVLYSVHIETFSSVSLSDILRYQLEQMRLAILVQDTEKASVLAKRISTRHMEEVPELREYYLNRMIFVHLGEGEYNNVSEIYSEIRRSAEMKEEGHTDKLDSVLDIPTMAILYGILALHSANTHKVLKESTESKLCKNESRMLGEMMMSNKLVRMDEVRKLVQDMPETPREIFMEHSKEIEQRVLEHNLIVVAKYYSRIQLQYIADLFCAQIEPIMEVITEMIRKGLLHGSVDQLAGTISFTPVQNEMTEWCTGIDKCLDVIMQITHSIAKV